MNQAVLSNYNGIKSWYGAWV